MAGPTYANKPGRQIFTTTRKRYVRICLKRLPRRGGARMRRTERKEISCDFFLIGLRFLREGGDLDSKHLFP